MFYALCSPSELSKPSRLGETNFLSFSLCKHAKTPAAPSAGCATICFFLSLSFPCKPEPGFCAIFKEQTQGMSVLWEVIGPACASI